MSEAKAATEVTTVAALIGLWPTIADFGRDLELSNPTHAQTIRVRGRIPVEHWPKVIAAAARRGIPNVSADLLMRLHAPAPAVVEQAAQQVPA